MMSRLMFSCAGDIRSYSGTIDICEQEAPRVHKSMWSGKIGVGPREKGAFAHHK